MGQSVKHLLYLVPLQEVQILLYFLVLRTLNILIGMPAWLDASTHIKIHKGEG